MTVTVHFVNDNFKITSLSLDTRYFPGSHTDKAISAMVGTILDEWNLNILLDLSNNARNMICASNDGKFTCIPCSIHNLQLAMSDAMRACSYIEPMLCKCCKLLAVKIIGQEQMKI